jgi:hypothetical protein
VNRSRWLVVAVVVVGILLSGAVSVLAKPISPVSVKGFETFPGIPCGENTRCGVAFRGWVTNPGLKGVVTVRAAYQGEVGFGKKVSILHGYWWIAIKRGPTLAGKVDACDDCVRWPPKSNDPDNDPGITQFYKDTSCEFPEAVIKTERAPLKAVYLTLTKMKMS